MKKSKKLIEAITGNGSDDKYARDLARAVSDPVAYRPAAAKIGTPCLFDVRSLLVDDDDEDCPKGQIAVTAPSGASKTYTLRGSYDRRLKQVDQAISDAFALAGSSALDSSDGDVPEYKDELLQSLSEELSPIVGSVFKIFHDGKIVACETPRQ